MGLYASSGMLCTQCEAEGFRRITYFPDRPDFLSRYYVKMTAENAAYTVLLSNGNLEGSGDLPDGRHWVCRHFLKLADNYGGNWGVYAGAAHSDISSFPKSALAI